MPNGHSHRRAAAWERALVGALTACALHAGKVDIMAILPYIWAMKTTIDLPDEVLHRAKVVAAQRRTTLKQLFVTGLELAMTVDADASARTAALARLRQGLPLGGQPLTREQAHERR